MKFFKAHQYFTAKKTHLNLSSLDFLRVPWPAQAGTKKAWLARKWQDFTT